MKSKRKGKKPGAAGRLPREAKQVPQARKMAKPRESAPEPRFGIVGIGASSSSIDELLQLVRALPAATGMAYVVVQALGRRQSGSLTKKLSSATGVSVAEVAADLLVEPNRIYVIPSGRYVQLRHGRLMLTELDEAGESRPIDTFLRSLAGEHRHRSVGVLLAGAGSDGTLGLEAIKAEGGITFAQQSISEQDGMTQSARRAGCVDLVLPPWQIAEELARIGSHPFVEDEEDSSGGLGGGNVTHILRVLHDATAVDFSHYKSTTLYRRIARRMLLHKLGSLNDYYKLLKDDPSEVQALYRDVLINVTSFFRDPAAFELIKKQIFPRLFSGRQRRDPMRLWVLGCSTGEEAYSLAIALSEFAEEHKRPLLAQVFATDLNDYGIETARAGIYTHAISREVSPERLRRWFIETDNGYQIVKSIRDMCVFARHNVLSDPPFSRMDLISCRNVLIYMDPMLQRKVVPLLYYALKPSGCLWLGSSETIGTFSELFMAEDQKHRIYLKNSAGAPPEPTAPSTAPRWEASVTGQQRGTKPRELPATDPQKEADRLVIARYAPPGVLVDNRLEVLQFRGDTSPYLMPAPGRPSTNLLKMAREGLLIGLRAVLQKAIKTGAVARREGVRVKTLDGFREIDLQVLPVRSGLGAERCWLVQFEERQATVHDEQASKPRATPKRPKNARLKADRSAREVARLNEELASTRDYMQTLIEQQEAANEELQSANEEVQSSNEELQSINEELQTSKEEIQPSNEELTTVNEELKNRNEELSQTTDDLTNFLASTNLALVKVSLDLKIRSFTPQAEKLMRLISTDVGRPIGDIKFPFQYDGLEQSLLKVIETVRATEQDVQDEAGHWYSLRLRPFRTADNRIGGAVLVLIDIHAQKQAADVLRESDRRKDEFLAVLAHELRTPLTSLALGFELYERAGKRALDDETLTAMKRQLQRLRRLVDDLLDVSRIAQGAIPLRMGTLELTALVRSTVDSMRAHVQADGRSFTVDLPDKSLRMYGDGMRLEQTLVNLLTNAVKFTEPHGQITVSLRPAAAARGEKPFAVLTVQDDGIGIDADTLPNIYDLFSRAPDSIVRDRQGLGVGLYLVKRLVELHGGSVSAVSRGRGKGSQFVVRLPLTNAALERADSERTQSSAPDGHARAMQPGRVLVVDDDADIVDTVGRVFRSCEQEVRTASNGTDALALAASFRPGLIVLDIAMPGMNGHEVAKRIRAIPELAETVLVALTGYNQYGEVDPISNSAFDARVTKPGSVVELENLLTLRRALKGRRPARSSS